ncbi:MBL fold metallo-hydrolase [Sneathiella marina]|uniref:MBL fold metallo-hydrolase n=1 Tax=Sneathiella marina TaxID=2950108 RepID=A0ABY4W430_9PROT|nr:MBL fold metallo-hydrolase [Sneathiella marina]USG61948.1 MBL fold metallo-hydrolase [Sneathiella marina]
MKIFTKSVSVKTASRGLLSAMLASLLLVACETTSQTMAETKKPPHHTAEGYRNLHIEHPDKNFFDFLYMRFFSDVEWADHESRAAEITVKDLDIDLVNEPGTRNQVSWLGHSTFLIQKGGKNILTDPIFADRASPVPFAGPARYIKHVVDYDKLPDIDYVVISHNHYDHLDSETISRLGNTPMYLVPLGLKAWFVEQGILAERIREHDWWDRTKLDGVTIQAMPSQHWSARGLGDRHETLWASWYLDFGDRTLWFGGDTGYNPVQFKEIGAATGGVDLALIPIGGYAPRSFMKTYHVNPEEAIFIHQDIQATKSIGMHWGTFPLTAEGPIDPQIELMSKRKKHLLSDEEFSTMIVGETFEW